jgi:hypothetical protein
VTEADLPTKGRIFQSSVQKDFYSVIYRIIEGQALGGVETFICESKLIHSDNNYDCSGGMLSIWANGDGWGGGCDVEYVAKFGFAGGEIQYCQSDKWLNHLYIGGEKSPISKNEHYIHGTFSKMLTKEKAIEMLQSLEFSK